MEQIRELKEILSARQLEDLPELMTSTKHRVTRFINDPRCMNLDELEKISEITGISQYILVTEFYCGYDDLTISDMDRIMKESGISFPAKTPAV